MAYTTIPADNETIANIPGDIRAVTALVTEHKEAASAAHAAGAISFTPTGTISSTTVQAAIAEGATDLSGHTGASSGAHAASAIGFTPTDDVSSATVQAAIVEAAATKIPGLESYIASGRKMSLNATALTVDISGGVYYSEKTVKRAANSVVLPARSANLVYDDADGNTGVVAAAFPAVDTATIARWIIDGSSAMVNSAVGVNGNTVAVANNLIKTGTVTPVDGWIGYGGKGDGSTGYYASSNSTGFPTGAAVRELVWAGFVNTLENGTLAGYGASSSNACFNIYNNTGQLVIDYYNSSNSTGYQFDNGGFYIIHVQFDGTNVLVYVNGNFISKTQPSMLTVANPIAIGKRPPTSELYSKSIHCYVELRNALRTPAQIAAISNALLLPCKYKVPYIEEFIEGFKYYDIATPENAVANGVYSTSYSIAGAFYKDGTTTNWASPHTYTGVSGVDWIGQKVASKIKKIRHTNYSVVTGNISSVKIQWSQDGVTNWQDIQIQTLPTTVGTATLFDVADYSVTGNHYIRELANANPGSGSAWGVGDIEMFTDVKPADYTDIRSILPAGSVSLGFVRTNSSSVVEIDDSSYKYGRREGTIGGNRKVFLGWKYYSGDDLVGPFKNPFGANAKLWAVAKPNLAYQLEVPLLVNSTGGSSVSGAAFNIAVNGDIYLDSGGTGVHYYWGNTGQTSGYIGCYAEVIE